MPKADEMITSYRYFVCVDEKGSYYSTKKSNGRFHHLAGINHILRCLAAQEFIPVNATVFNGSSMAKNRLDAVIAEYVVKPKDSAFGRTMKVMEKRYLVSSFKKYNFI